jgi:hypothetical protein
MRVKELQSQFQAADRATHTLGQLAGVIDIGCIESEKYRIGDRIHCHYLIVARPVQKRKTLLLPAA